MLLQSSFRFTAHKFSGPPAIKRSRERPHDGATNSRVLPAISVIGSARYRGAIRSMAVAMMSSKAVTIELTMELDIDLLSSVARSAAKTAHLPRTVMRRHNDVRACRGEERALKQQLILLRK